MNAGLAALQGRRLPRALQRAAGPVLLGLAGLVAAASGGAAAQPVAKAAATSPARPAAQPVARDVAATIIRAARWQLANPSGTDTRDWVIAPLYDGLVAAALATGDARLMAPVIDLGTQSGWMLGPRGYFADDHAVGHAWLDLYLLDGKKRAERLGPVRERMSHIADNPISEALVYHQQALTPGLHYVQRWTWCDALYMAPPTLTRLYAATGDKKFLAFMDSEFRYTFDHLWDPKEKLFFRDASFFEQKSSNGSKIFWARGNGWVYAGIAQLLIHLPADHPTRGWYIGIFRQMTEAIVAAQQADGLWRPSLLDPAEADVGETSGSAFFVYGLAWGVNNGILDKRKHARAIARGWQGLTTRVKPDGYVGYVQPISSGPKFHAAAYETAQADPAVLAALPKRNIDADSKQDYGTGAFLLAGSEVLRMAGGATRKSPQQVTAEAQALYEQQQRVPRALARLVPERAHDLAWENDKVAFRIYGPPLRGSVEDSGIDAWFKRVPTPVLNKWYALHVGPPSTAEKPEHSYHIDRGEGLDGFHTGDTRGVGGLGLWIDGKLLTSDTYTQAAIHWSGPDVAEFSNVYTYPVKLDGKTVYEHRYTRLRMGQRLAEFSAFFSTDNSQRAKPLLDFPHEVAIGLVTQDAARASVVFDTAAGTMAVTEPIDGHRLGTGVVVARQQPVRSQSLPAPANAPKNAHGLLLTRVDTQGYVRWRAGFAWSADGDITTPEQWLAYLAQQAAPR